MEAAIEIAGRSRGTPRSQCALRALEILLKLKEGTIDIEIARYALKALKWMHGLDEWTQENFEYR
jgi:Holliday junction DNA helicase RuvB